MSASLNNDETGVNTMVVENMVPLVVMDDRKKCIMDI